MTTPFAGQDAFQGLHCAVLAGVAVQAMGTPNFSHNSSSEKRTQVIALIRVNCMTDVKAWEQVHGTACW